MDSQVPVVAAGRRANAGANVVGLSNLQGVTSVTFFRPGAVSDSEYADIRDSSDARMREAHDYIEHLWRLAADFVDPNLPLRAQSDFHAAFWELYLTAALLDLNLPVVRWRDRRPGASGPDIQLALPQGVAWIEACIAGAGHGDDAVEEATLGAVREVPDDPITLRLLNSVSKKKKQYVGWLDASLVLPTEPFIIAVNGTRIPSALLETTVPRIVRALLGVGHQALDLNPEDRRVVGEHHEHRTSVTKKNGATVPTDQFLRTESSSVSAVLYAWGDVWNRPDPIGAEFVIVHNPNAQNPLTHGTIPRGAEYWSEDPETIRRRHHRPAITEGTP